MLDYTPSPEWLQKSYLEAIQAKQLERRCPNVPHVISNVFPQVLSDDVHQIAEHQWNLDVQSCCSECKLKEVRSKKTIHRIMAKIQR